MFPEYLKIFSQFRKLVVRNMCNRKHEIEESRVPLALLPLKDADGVFRPRTNSRNYDFRKTSRTEEWPNTRPLPTLDNSDMINTNMYSCTDWNSNPSSQSSSTNLREQSR
jgi:hypothetical protein